MADTVHKQVESADMVEKLESSSRASTEDIELENPNVHQSMNPRLFMSLVAMSFLWVGSQIPLYLYGSVLPTIYSDIGGADQYTWMIVAYLIPLSSVCPFCGNLSDMFGRKAVGAAGQVLLIIGPIVVSTAKTMNTAIGGMVLCGLGAGLNELISLAGTGELVPIRKRPAYIGAVLVTITPFIPSALWAELISETNWRYNGVLIGVWNLLGLILLLIFYKDPAALLEKPQSKKEILSKIDWIGGFLSVTGVLLFMVGMQFGVQQYTWSSAHVLGPLIVGFVLCVAFFVYEMNFAPYPMVPKKLFAKDKRSIILLLLLTFFSGGNFFACLLFWPTQTHNMYSPDPVSVGLRTLPVGFGIIIGAVVTLIAIGLSKGRTWGILVFSTLGMTAFTGAVAVARTDNLQPTTLAMISMASLFTGAVIIPSSIIAQIICPTELIGTITAISLSVRYIGGAVAFSVYYNIFYAKFFTQTTGIGLNIVKQGVYTGYDISVLTDLVTYAAQAQFDDLRELIASNKDIPMKDTAFDAILALTQNAFATAYQYPYFISIAFGGICVLCALGMRDIRAHM